MRDEQIREKSVRTKLNKYNECDLPKFSLEPHVAEIEELFTAASVEGVFENLQKSKSEFAQKQLKILSKMVKLYISLNFFSVGKNFLMAFC